MRKKIFTFLLALAASVGLSWAASNDKLPGKFSVSASQVVYFSQGNLQYTKSTGKWKIMDHQYDVVETLSQNVGTDYASQDVITLFGWGTSGWDNTAADATSVHYQPYSTCKTNHSTAINNYQYGPSNANVVGSSKAASAESWSKSDSYKNYDWGVKNSSDLGSGWRVLTTQEWGYLFNTRTPGNSVNGVSNARYTEATINTDGTAVNGIILFPDDATLTTVSGVTWGTINGTSAWGTKCTSAGWTALEAAGCVFLPAASYRDGTSVYNERTRGFYWSSSAYSENYAWGLDFYSGSVNPQGINGRYDGCSVRLVSETAPTPEPSETTVTWDWSDMESMGNQGGYFKAKGITLMAYGVENGIGGYGSHEGAYFCGPFVFTTSLGKFTKIEVTNSYLYDQPAFSGDGWTLDGTNAVWEGTPAALVSLVSNFGGITQIKFTIDPNTSTPANSCGDGLTWAVNDGVLTISYDGVGTGSMDNYDDYFSMPWHNKTFTSVVLPEGLISIGQNAFAFINTFSQITLPSTLQYILMNAFSGCGLTSVTIPENVKGISASAFISSQSLATVTFEPTTPPRVGGNAFENCHNDLIIYYPCESRAQYYKDMQADIASYHDKMYNCPAPPSNLHVTELEAPASWSGKSTYLAVADMPGFEETDAELAETWEAPTNCNSILIYHVTEQYGDDRMYYHYFSNGNHVSSEDGWYPLGTVYSNANKGIKTFYTSSGGGSTPTNPVIKLNADFSGSWADTEAFTDNGDGTASLSVTTLTAGSWYHFGVKVDDTWVSDNAAFSRENPSRVIEGNESEMWFQADIAGTYTFTWAYESNTLTIGYPAVAPTPTPSGDKLPGAFTVDNTGKQVNFSKGNVQYVGGSWKFADNQWDMIGNAQADNNRDLFGWGTGSEPNKTIEDESYYTTFTDWGTNFGEGWRTLTKDEWIYLLETRDNAANLRTLATVNSVKGLILMPDGWTASGVALAVTLVNYTSNMINDESKWATLANQGCVFLPAAGYRSGNEVSGVGVEGYYFSSTNYSDNHAAHMAFEPHSVTADQYTFAYCGNSVRLVTDAGGSTPTPSIPTVGMKGSWDDWADAVNFTDNGNGTASAAKSFEHEGYYTFKTVLDGDDWRGNGEAFKRDYTGATSITGNTDMTLWIDAKGEYTFTWTYATNAIGIAYPTLPTIQTKGSWDNWTDALNFTDNGDGTASVTKHFDAEGYHDFKINVGADDWRGNGETFKRDYTGAQWIKENGSDMKLYVDEPGDYTFTWSYVENALSIALPAQSAREVETNGDPQDPTYYYSTFYHSANKYALPEDVEAFVADLSGSELVLTKIAVTGQTIPSNTAVILRRANSPEKIQLIPSNAEAVTFTAHNSLQGVDMATAAPANCYVLSGTTQYGVGFYRINSSTLKAHKAYVIYNGSAAPKRMRFVFNQEQTATGMEDVQGSVQTTKILRNDQIIIIRNGVEYTINGQIVK